MPLQSKLDELLLMGGVAPPPSSKIEIKGQDPVVDSPYRLGEAGAVSLAAQGAAIAALWHLRSGHSQNVAVDVTEAALSLKSVLYLRNRNYEVHFPEPVYPTIAFYTTRDNRTIMMHGGYPALRDKLLKLLKCANDTDQIKSAVACWDAGALEDAIAEQGGCGTIARSQTEWLDHPQGKALTATPLLDITRSGNSPLEIPARGLRPLSGLRVLDMTHVLAGPTAARVLAEQGADVLRISSPRRPALQGFIMDTGHGKLSTMLDLAQEGDADRFRALLSEADVLLYSYRPGGLDRLGFSDETIRKIRPGLIFASLSCYGEVGPWRDRAGWEQLAQTATGMAVTQGSTEQPKLASVFPNDYITGYLAAFGILAALLRRSHEGGSYRVRASLCRTAMWLQSFAPTPTGQRPGEDALARVAKRLELSRNTAWGPLTYLGPITRFSETPPHWERPTTPLAHDPVLWPAGPRFSSASPETADEAALYAHEIVQI
ncbi:MAG: CoA transferase [Rhodospirillaceae bacterium]